MAHKNKNLNFMHSYILLHQIDLYN